MVKNKFNLLTSKEWLPFQKSWTRLETLEKLYADNLRFFTKPEEKPAKVAFWGSRLMYQMVQSVGVNCNCSVVEGVPEQADFAIADLRFIQDVQTYRETKPLVAAWLESIFKALENRRFVCLFVPNILSDTHYFPSAWDLALSIAEHFSLKDEKIICLAEYTKLDTFYALYFRKDEDSRQQPITTYLLFEPSVCRNVPQEPHWFILKPTPRKKNEVLHPAKYPEELVTKFVNYFTKEGDAVFDPMSGTGSTQVGSIRLGRKGYGTELSAFFGEIANERIRAENLTNNNDAFVLVKDARLISSTDFPKSHYLLTSPPYWDMLNMKGAENQAKRKEKGLQLNYSDSQEDLGNVADYHHFLSELVEVYKRCILLLESYARVTIIVKNIKKKGKNYPFAWDLARQLAPFLDLQPEMFWLQDDLSIAPYGYGNTWVSNTFHQYCLHFVVKS